MFKLIFFVVLLPLSIVLLFVFFKGLMDLHEQEKGELERYIDSMFGKGKTRLFQSILDDAGEVRHLVYSPDYQWFKSPKYRWFEVSTENNGFRHNEVARESY